MNKERDFQFVYVNVCYLIMLIAFSETKKSAVAVYLALIKLFF